MEELTEEVLASPHLDSPQHKTSPGLTLSQVAGSLAYFARERVTPFVREQGGWVGRNN